MNTTDWPRREVLYTYARAHDRFTEREQQLRRSGMLIHAEGARQYANRVIRAWLAERDDPKPEDLP